LKKSRYGRKPKQKRTLDALGLRRIGSSVEQTATDNILGMVEKVSHLVLVEEID
jgi:large subunit ribosomal protein L30